MFYSVLNLNIRLVRTPNLCCELAGCLEDCDARSSTSTLTHEVEDADLLEVESAGDFNTT